MTAWYAFRTEIKAEKRAQSGIEALGFNTFVPSERRIIIRRRRKVEHERPLFARYGFVKFDIEKDEWGPIKSVDGVESLLGGNLMPVRIPAQQIESLQLAQKYGLFDRTKPVLPFKIGDKVEIGEGPFAGFIGKVLKARSDERIDVLLDFFGSQRAIEFQLLHIRENRI